MFYVQIYFREDSPVRPGEPYGSLRSYIRWEEINEDPTIRMVMRRGRYALRITRAVGVSRFIRMAASNDD